MQDTLVHGSNAPPSLLDSIVSARYDLALLSIGLIGYFILSSMRNKRSVKEIKCKADVTYLEQKVTEAEQKVESAPEQLKRVLESMSRGDSVPHTDITAELYGFFDRFPDYNFSGSEVQAIMNFCSCPLADEALPNALFERVKSSDEWQTLSMFINFYLNSEQPEKACDVYELNYSTFFDSELDEDIEWRLILAALQCERQPLAEHLLQTSQTNSGQRIAFIQQWWRTTAARMSENRVARMGSVFNRLSTMFNDRFPFEEDSDAESTCYLGESSDQGEESDDSYSGAFD